MLLFALVATAPGGCTVNPVPTPGDEAADPAVPATDAGSFASEDTNKGTGGGLADSGTLSDDDDAGGVSTDASAEEDVSSDVAEPDMGSTGDAAAAADAGATDTSAADGTAGGDVVSCVPGNKKCLGKRVATCTATGDGWTTMDCPPSRSCNKGHCKK